MWDFQLSWSCLSPYLLQLVPGLIEVSHWLLTVNSSINFLVSNPNPKGLFCKAWKKKKRIKQMPILDLNFWHCGFYSYCAKNKKLKIKKKLIEMKMLYIWKIVKKKKIKILRPLPWQRWEFIKENKKVRKQWNMLSTKNAIKEKKITRSRQRKKKEKTSFFLHRFLGGEFVFFLFSYFLTSALVVQNIDSK